MKNLYYMLLALLLAVGTTVVAGCPTTGDDDDDTAGDDDDDDDDDDDAAIAEITFGGILTVDAEGGDDDDSAGDDDDSAAGDDDDSAGDDDDSAASNSAREGSSALTGGFTFRLWSNLDAQILVCQQNLSFEGVAQWGFGVASPDCDNCAGQISVDPASVLDISDPNANPDDCAPEQIEGADYGSLMLTEPPAGEAGGDYLEMYFVDIATAVALGLEMTDGTTGQTVVDDAPEGFTAAGILYLLMDGYFGSIGLDQAAGSADVGGDTGAFWIVYAEDGVNDNPPGLKLLGEYRLASFWLLTTGN